MTRFEKFSLWISIITIGFGIYGAYVYYKQLALMQVQLTESQRQWRIGLRPYMIPSEFEIYKTDSKTGRLETLQNLGTRLASGDLPQLEVVIVNSGGSPAKDVRYLSHWDLVAKFPDNNVEWKNDGVQQTVRTVPKDGKFIISYPIDRRLTPEEVRDILTPTDEGFDRFRKYLVIVGYVTYSDIFDDPKSNFSTRFCFAYSPNSNQMAGCPSHSDAK